MDLGQLGHTSPGCVYIEREMRKRRQHRSYWWSLEDSVIVRVVRVLRISGDNTSLETIQVTASE
eukprot:1859104-Prymnesium_polylepis.1